MPLLFGPFWLMCDFSNRCQCSNVKWARLLSKHHLCQLERARCWWGEAGAEVWRPSQMIFFFLCDIYAVCVIMRSLGLAQFPHCRANCATGVCVEMSPWYNPWQYQHISHIPTSPSLCSAKRSWLSATCHTSSTPIQAAEKGNGDELFILKRNFKYIINLHSVVFLHHIIPRNSI